MDLIKLLKLIVVVLKAIIDLINGEVDHWENHKKTS